MTPDLIEAKVTSWGTVIALVVALVCLGGMVAVYLGG